MHPLSSARSLRAQHGMVAPQLCEPRSVPGSQRPRAGEWDASANDDGKRYGDVIICPLL